MRPTPLLFIKRFLISISISLAATVGPLLAQTVTYNTAKHETLSQTQIVVNYTTANGATGFTLTGTAAEQRSMWTVKIGGTAVTVTNVAVLGLNVIVTFDASALAGHTVLPAPFIMPGETMTVAYAGGVASGAIQVSPGGAAVPVLAATSSVNNWGSATVCSADVGERAVNTLKTPDTCSPVTTDWIGWTYEYSVRWRNSSKFVLGLNRATITWNDGLGSTATISGFYSDEAGAANAGYYRAAGVSGVLGPAFYLTFQMGVGVFSYPANTNQCNFRNSVTIKDAGGSFDCSGTSGLKYQTQFDSFDWDSQNTGALAYAPTVANSDKVCLGTNVNMTFTDNTDENCNPATAADFSTSANSSGPANNGIRWVRFIYGSNGASPLGTIPDIRVGGVQVTNTVTGAFIAPYNANPLIGGAQGYVVTGAGGPGIPGIPDANGVIELAVPTNEPSGLISSLITTIDPTHQVLGQRFWVTLQYWNVCNRYDAAASPVSSTTQFVQIVSVPAPLTTTGLAVCFGTATPQNFTVGSVAVGATAINFYNKNPVAGGATLMQTGGAAATSMSSANYTAAKNAIGAAPGGGVPCTGAGCFSLSKTNGAYYSVWATQVVGGSSTCESEPIEVVIIQQPDLSADTPAVPTGATNVCNGDVITYHEANAAPTKSIALNTYANGSAFSLATEDLWTTGGFTPNPTPAPSTTTAAGAASVVTYALTTQPPTFVTGTVGTTLRYSLGGLTITSPIAAPFTPPSYTINYITSTATAGCFNGPSNLSVNVYGTSAGGTITPSTQTICEGGAVTTITVSGTVPLPLRGTVSGWEKKVNAGAFGADGTLGTALSITPTVPIVSGIQTTYQYRALIQNGPACSSVYSPTATIIVNPTPTTATIALGSVGSLTICKGSSTTIKVTLPAAGSGGGTPNYTLIYRANGVNQAAIANYVSGTDIAVSPIVNTTYDIFSVQDSQGCFAITLSGSVAVAVKSITAVLATNGATALCPPPNTTTLKATITDANGNALTTYKVNYQDNLGANYTTGTGYVSGSAITLTNVPSPGLTYHITSVTEDVFGCVTSTNTGTPTITVGAPISAATFSGGGSVCLNLTQNLVLTITNGVGPYQVTIHPTSGPDIVYPLAPLASAYVSGANIPVPTNAVGTITYSAAVIVDQCGFSFPIGSIATNAQAVTVNALPVVTNQTPTVCSDVSGGTTATVDLTGLQTAIGGVGPSYAWFTGYNAGTKVFSGAIASPTTAVVTNGVSVFCRVTDGNTCVSPATVTYTVNPKATITTQPTLQTACSGLSATYTVAATGTTLGFQWQEKINAGAFTNLSDGTVGGITYAGTGTNTLTITNVSGANTYSYRAIVTSFAGSCSFTSNAAGLTVNPLPAETDQTPTACSDLAGGTTATVDLTTQQVLINGAGGLSFAWFTGYTPATKVFSGAIGTPASFVVTNAVPVFCRVTTIATGCVSPATVTYTVNPKATFTNLPATATNCVGDSRTFTIAAAGAGLTYKWQENGVNITDGTFGTVVYSGSTTASLTLQNITAALNTHQFRAVLTTTGSCNLNSNATTLTVNPLPTVVNLTPSVCSDVPGGNQKQLDLTVYNTAINAGAGTTVTVTWWLNYALGVFSNPIIPGNAVGQDQKYTVTNGDQLFAKVVTNATSCVNVATANFTVKITPNDNLIKDGTGTTISTVATSPVPFNICSSNSSILFQTDATINVGSTFNWTVPVVSYAGEFTVVTASANILVMKFPNSTEGVGASLYKITGIPITVTETLNGCPGNPVTMNVHVIAAPPASVITGDATVCDGGIANYSVPFVLGSTYAWTLPPGATITSLPVTANAITVQMSSFSGNVSVVSSNGTCVSPAAAPFPVTIVTRPVLSTTVNPVCSGSNVSTAVTLGSSVPGSTFNWVVLSIAGSITGVAVGDFANSVASISQTPFNTSGIAGSITYQVTPVGPGPINCTGNPQTFSVTVNAEPVLNLTNKTLCSKESAQYEIKLSPLNLPAGTLFSWAAPAMSFGPAQGNASGGLIPMGAAGTIHINDNFINKNSFSITATYTITAVSGAGCNSSQALAARQVVFTINPEPVGINTTQPICSGNSFTINPQTNNINVVGGNNVTSSFTWTAVYGSVTGGAGSGSIAVGGSLSETLHNITGGPIIVTYTIFPTSQAPANCAGVPAESFTHQVTVNPEPVGINTLESAICSGAGFTAINPQTHNINVVGGNSVTSSFTWTAVYGAVTGGAGAGAIAVGGTLPSETLLNKTSAPINVVYTLFPTSSASSCPGVPARFFTITIPVNPEPVGINTSQSICSGTSFTINPQTNNINAVGGNSVTSSFTWTAIYGAVTGGAGAGIIAVGGSLSETLHNVSSGPVIVTYKIFPTSQTGSCPGVPAEFFNHQVTVNPEPVGINTLETSICSGSGFAPINPQTHNINVVGGNSVTSSFTWTATYGAVTGGVGSGTIAVAGSLPSETLINKTSAPINVVYKLFPTSQAPASCAGVPAEFFTITIPVNPEPVGINTVQSICSGTSFSINPQTNNISVVGGNSVTSSFTWTAVYGAVTGGVGSGSIAVGGNLSETLHNVTGGPIIVIYTISPTAQVGACPGIPAESFTHQVTVNPEPVGVNTMQAAICSGAGFTPINPQTNNMNVFGGNGVISSFTWTATYGAVTGGLGSGTIALGANLPSETLVNKTGAPINVVYKLFPTSQAPASCTGVPAQFFTITIPVNPEPVGINTTQPICSGTSFTINPQTNNINAVGGNSVTSSFTWTAVYGAVTGGAGAGVIAVAGSLSETLHNVTGAPVVVTYTISPIAQTGGCVGVPAESFTHKVTVNPEPVGINTIESAVCSGAGFAAINPQTHNINAVGGNGVISSFTWTAVYGSVTGGAGAGSIAVGASLLSEPLVNKTSAQINVVYKLFPTSQAPASCAGVPAEFFTITIPVNPEPVGINTTQPICSGTSFTINPQTNNISVAGGNSVTSSFTWTAVYGAVTGGTGSGVIAVGGSLSETLHNVTGGPVIVTYTIFPTSQTGSCPGSPAEFFTHKVTVNPEPVGINTLETAVCSGDGFAPIDPQTHNINAGAGNSVTSSFTWTATYGAVTGGSGSGSISVGGTLGSEPLVNKTSAPINVIYKLFPTSSPLNCAGVPAQFFTITIPVDPEPVGINTVQTICSGTSFSIDPQANNISVAGGNSVVSSFTWTATYGAVTGGVGSGSIAVGGSLSETLHNVTGGAIIVTYTLSPTSQTGNCSGTPAEFFTHKVTVNPEPVGVNTIQPAICSGAGFAPINPQTNNINIFGGNGVISSFTWTATYGAVTGGLGSGSIALGANLPSETLINKTTAQINVVYKLFPTSQAPASCTGVPAQFFTITIPVNPEPVGINTTQQICSGTSFTINPQTNNINAVGGNSVTSSFTWTAAYGAVTGGLGSGTIAVGGSLSETLHNVSGGPVIVTYTIFPIAQTGSCAGVPGESFTHKVTVNPEPIGINTLESAICSGTGFTAINPQTHNINAVGGNSVISSFTWTAVYGAVTGGAGSGTIAVGANLPSETLTNKSSAQINVVYKLFPTSQAPANCAGVPAEFFTITVPVNPEPVGINTTDIICSGNSFSTNPQANNINVVGGNNVTSSFTWSAVYGAVTGGAGSGVIAVGGSLSETLHNVTGGSIIVTYTIFPTSQAGGCPGAPPESFTHKVTVNPEPLGAPNPMVICSRTPLNFDIQTVLNNTYPGGNTIVGNSVPSIFKYSVTSSPAAAGVFPGPNRNSPSAAFITDTYTNTSNIDATVTYTIIPFSTADNCAGAPFDFSVVIHPEPVGSNFSEPNCNTSLNHDIQTQITNGLTSVFTYAISQLPVGALALPANRTIASSSPITDSYVNLTGSPVVVTYTISAFNQAFPTCGASTTFTYNVTISPKPTGVSDVKGPFCSNASISIDPQGNIVPSVASTFAWTATYDGSPIPSGTGVITGSFSNTSAAHKLAVYTIIPTAQGSGCVGAPFTIQFFIDPQPVMKSTLANPPAICSTNTASTNITNVILDTDGVSVAAASFIVTLKSQDAGLTGTPTVGTFVAVAGQSNGIKNDTYRNTTAAQLKVVYTVVPKSAAGCLGTAFDITVLVNPEPVLFNPGFPAVCSNNATSTNIVNITLSTNGTSVNAASYQLIQRQYSNGGPFSTTLPANFTPDGGNAAVGGPALGINLIQNDKFNNVSAVPVTVRYTIQGTSSSGCVSNLLDYDVVVNPEPTMSPGAIAECSGIALSTLILAPVGGTPAIVSYDLQQVLITNAFVTPAGGNQALGPITATSLQTDVFTNTSNADQHVIYKIVPVAAGSCRGIAQFVDVTVHPAPDLLDNLGTTVCSGDVSGITLSTRVSPSPSTPADHYKITNIVKAAALVPVSFNSTFPRSGAANGIASDSFTNPTNGILTVVYTVVPVSLPGCEGPAETVTLTVEPTVAMIVPPNVNTCSDTPNSPNAWSIILDSNTTPSAGAITFDYTAVASPVGAVSGFIIGQSSLPRLTAIADKLVNTSNNVATVTYTITPRAMGAKSGAGCSAPAPTIVTVTVEPRPKLSVSPSTQVVCEGDPSSMTMNTTTVPGTGTVEFQRISAVATGGMTQTLPSPATTLYHSGDVIADTWDNPTILAQTVTYTFRARFNGGLGCQSDDITLVLTVNPRPSVTASSQAPICGDGTSLVNITLTPDIPTANNSWTAVVIPAGAVTGAGPGSGNLIFQTLKNTTTASAIVRYTVTPKAVGCAGTPLIFDVQVDPIPDVLGLPTSINVCYGTTLNIPLTSSVAGTTFSWTVDANDLGVPLTGSGSTINQVISNTTGSQDFLTYTVFATGPGATACMSQGKIMNVISAPQMNGQILNAATWLCTGSKDFLQIQLDGQAPFTLVYTDGTTNFTLTKVGNFKSIQVQPTATTTYSLVSMKDAFGCSYTPVSSVVYTVGETDATFSIVGPAASCSPYQVSFKYDQKAGTEYTWRWGDGIIDSTYTATSDVTGQVVLHTYVNSSPTSTLKPKVVLQTDLPSPFPGCFKSTTQTVNVYPSIITNVFPDKSVICSGDQIRFTNQSFGVSGTGNRWFYRVQGNAGQELEVQTTKNVVYTLNNTSITNPIIFEVVYQSTNGNCPAPDIITPITVYRGVTASFDQGPSPHLLVGGNVIVNFTNTSNPIDAAFRYDWDFSLDATPGTFTGQAPPPVNYTSQGPRDVVLVATNIAAEAAGLSCASQFTQTVDVVLPPLKIDIEVIPPASCFPADITVTRNLSTGDRFLWKLSDANGLVSTSTDSLPTFHITNPGLYSIIFQTWDHFYPATIASKGPLDFVVYARPIASFDDRPSIVFVPDTELSTFNFSLGANGNICTSCSYLWDFGDNGTSIEFEPKYTYKVEGKYLITMIVSEDHGDAICTDTTTHTVTAKQGGLTKVPNAFTPNPNGPNGGISTNGSFNDVFLPIVKGVEEFNLQIYDRWGNLIFESNSSTIGWDGYNKEGRLLPAGVYVYKLTIRLSDNQRSTQIGDVTMIR